MISDEMVERAWEAYWADKFVSLVADHENRVRAALEAALQPAEAVAGLVEQLHTARMTFDWGRSAVPLFREAADTIVRLAAERDDLDDECNKSMKTIAAERTRATAAEAERDKLREALRSIAEGNLGDAPWQANYDKIREAARAALGEKADV